jgi:2-desacetyl-2-hydroxyethyl bacteriochlorophyllide A dehydrogenase
MKNKKLLVTKPWKIEFVEDDFNKKIEGPNDVILKNKYSHISAGTESACVAGIESWFNIPDTPGYTAVAEIVDKGNSINHAEVGDLVYTYGHHAQYFKIDATDRWHGVFVKLPNGVNPEHASFTHMAGIAMTAIRASKIELGDVVLVTGLGAIGNIASQLAQLQGATVVATDINDSRIELAKKAGIEHAINSTKTDIGDYLKSLSGGKLASTYIDASGMSPVIEKSIQFTELYGEVILLGTPRKPYETNLTDTLQKTHLLPHCVTMKGALEFTFPTHETEFVKHSIERNAKIIMNLMKENKLKIAPFYSHKMNPADCQAAYEGLRDKPDEYIGVVFDWTKL